MFERGAPSPAPGSFPPPTETETDSPTGNEPLWPGDTGTLPIMVRRTLLHLVNGPYLSAAEHSAQWGTLLAHRDLIASRLADLFLSLVIDDSTGFAFTRNARSALDTETDLPAPLRSTPLTFAQTVLLLLLRQQLVSTEPEERVYIDKQQLRELAQPYLETDRTDERGLDRSFNGAWTQIAKLNLLSKVPGEERYEISPILRIIFGADEIAQLRSEYDRLLTAKREHDQSGSDDAALAPAEENPE
jgi:hypothetical protein